MQPHGSSRPTSDLTLSVYSQDEAPRSSSVYPHDVSPPDSPDVMGEHHRTDRASFDVSPISATPSPTLPLSPTVATGGSKRYNSNLPLPKSNTKKFWKLPGSAKGSEHLDTSTVRWDEYSGEPTAGEQGKPPSATPGSIKLRETPGSLKLRPNFGNSTTISSNHAPARKRVGGREIAEAPIMIRPEWKGAGGRHSIVKPLFDKPLRPGEDHNFPAGSSHRQSQDEQDRGKSYADRIMERGQQKSLEPAHADWLEKEQEAIEAKNRADERAEQEQRERERDQQHRLARVRIEKAKRERERILQAQEQSERRVKERSDRNAPLMPDPLRTASKPSSPQHEDPPTRTFTPPVSQTDATERDLPPPITPDFVQTASESTSPTVHNPRTRVTHSGEEDMRSPLARNPSREELGGRRNQSLPALPPGEHDQPLAGGSKDGAAGATTSQNDSFPESDFRTGISQMSLDNQLRSRFSATTIATTAYDNSPPLTPEMQSNTPTAANTPDSILNRKRPVAPAGIVRRKPAPAQGGTTNGIPRTDSKSLPKPPADAEAVDPIQTLQAKVDVLRRRRRNLETVIHELTNVVQPSSIAYDRASRAEIQKTVAGLEKELSEVVKDEYDTGLRLHRAWKRHEDFAAYEPTSIWVRRVTR